METKELITLVGLDPEKVKTADEFKAAMETDWIRREAVSKDPDIFGKIAGMALSTAQANIIREFKDNGIELTSEDLKEKKLTEIQKLGLSRLVDSYKGKLTEAEKKAGLNNDDKVKDLETQKAKAMKDLEDERALKNSLVNEYKTFKETVETEKKSKDMTDLFQAEYAKVKVTELATPVKRGYTDTFKEMYEFEVDEASKKLIARKDGKIVTSKKQVGQPAEVSELWEQFCDTEKILQKNGMTVGKGANDAPRLQGQKASALDDLLVVGGRARVMNK